MKLAFKVLGEAIGVAIDVIAKMAPPIQALIRVAVPAFAGVAKAALEMAGFIINAAATAFGWQPGVGPKLRRANAAFKEFKEGAQAQLGALAAGARNVGRQTAEGLAAGLAERSGLAVATARQTANKVIAQLNRTLEVASPSKVTKRIGRGLVDGLVGGIISGRSNVDAAIGKIVDLVKDKLSGRAESGLLGYVKRQARELRAAERIYERAADRVKEAKDALQGALRERFQFAGGIASGLAGDASIFGGLEGTGEDNPATAGGLAEFMRAQLGRLRQFATDLRGLVARGLSGSLIGEIAGGGLARGGQTARLLAGVDDATLRNFSDLQSQIEQVTAGIGSRAAESVFGGNIVDLRQDLAASELQLRRANTTLDNMAERIGDHVYRAIARAQGTPIRVGV